MSNINQLSEQTKKEMISKNIWNPECPLALERLSLISFSYYNFNGEKKNDGELVVLDVSAKYVAKIMDELFELKFPIFQSKTIEKYNGNDDSSMTDNNSSGFNFRYIAGTNMFSLHGYGLAIDINPQQNPFLVFENNKEENFHLLKVFPKAGVHYINRNQKAKGMVETIVDIFYKNGFRIWGGNWDSPIDYHHFQTPRWLAEILSNVDKEMGQKIFDYYVMNPAIETKDELLNIFKDNK